MHDAKGWPVGFLLLLILGNFSPWPCTARARTCSIWHRYYIPTFAIIRALLAGLGLEVLRERLLAKTRRGSIAVAITMLVLGYPQFDRSQLSYR